MTKIVKISLSILLFANLAACGSDTVIHERPVVVQTAPSAYTTPGSVERTCEHGYDNAQHACY